MSAPLSIILSASAGRDEKHEIVDRLAGFFGANDIAAHIAIAPSGEEIIHLVHHVLTTREGPIVAGGGDGTVNAVASVLVETGRTLGVLPLGTLNHFAKDLGIPLDLNGALRTLIEGSTATIDVGEVNGRIFLNNSSLGLYPTIVHKRERLQERLEYGKWPAFARAVLSALRRYPFLLVRLSVDGEELVRHTPFIFVGNNEYRIEGLDIGARTRLDSGCLWLYAAHNTGRLGLLRFAFRAIRHKLREERDFDRLCAKRILIESRHSRLRVARDGEVELMHTPLYYRIRPRALRVIVPAPAPALAEPAPADADKPSLETPPNPYRPLSPLQ